MEVRYQGSVIFLPVPRKHRRSVLSHWRKVIGAAMRARSLAATSQTRLLLGPANVVRIHPTLGGAPIELNDYKRTVDGPLPAASAAVERSATSSADFSPAERSLAKIE
jgi:hypothetical protein